MPTAPSKPIAGRITPGHKTTLRAPVGRWMTDRFDVTVES
jgi:hypothetical protein